MSDEPQTEDTMIAALLREREGLVQRGLKDRVAQVDEQLKLRGYTPQRRGPQGKPQTPPPGDPGQGAGDQQQGAAPPKGRQQPGKNET
jgi:hypothetical protein